jgi:hypothetical protein
VEGRGDAVVQSSGHTQGSDFRLGLATYELSARVELMHEHEINPTVGFHAFYLDIRSTSPRLPSRLFNGSVGVASPIAKFGDWFAAASASVGYAGDAAFSDDSAYYGRGTLLFGRKFGEDQSLLIALDYNGNRAEYPDIPLPGVAYSKRISDELSVVVGFPYSSFEWKRTPFTVRADYAFPQSLNVDAGYAFAQHWEVYGGLRSIQEAFHLSRLEADRRIIFEQRRAEAGVRWDPTKNLKFVLGAGYAFGSKFGVGFDARKTNKLEKGSDEPYVRVGFELRQ